MKTKTFKIDNYKVVITRKKDPKSNGGTTVHIFEDSSDNVLMGWSELYDTKETPILRRATENIENYMRGRQEMNTALWGHLAEEKKATDDLIKDWYLENYPDDEEGNNIKDTTTFADLYTMLINGKGDIYKLIGVADSLIRERLFEHLSYSKDVDYNVIYDLWLKCV